MSDVEINNAFQVIMMSTYGNLYFRRVPPFQEDSKYTSAILFIFQRDNTIESNRLVAPRVWTLQAAQSMKEGFMVVKPVIDVLLKSY